MRPTASQRFRAKWEMDRNGCWVWTGSETEDGYGTLWLNGRPRRAHRVSYEMTFGGIPDGMQLDHRCRVRNCVNPYHLEPVTARENTMRSPVAVAAIHAAKTHCLRGHRITEPTDYYVRSNGSRSCRRCQLIRTQRYRARKEAS